MNISDAITCVVCETRIHLQQGKVVTYAHDDVRWDGDHDAQPKLAHPMDIDPFAGVDA